MPRPTKNYILIVDGRRRASRQRNTHGRYRVGARSPEEAVKLLRAAIGFGSIRVYYEINPRLHGYDGPPVAYKTVVQMISDRSPDGKSGFRYVEPHHACDPHESYAERIRRRGPEWDCRSGKYTMGVGT